MTKWASVAVLELSLNSRSPLLRVTTQRSDVTGDKTCQSGYAMAVVSYDDETQIVVPVQGFLPQVFTFSSPPFVESSQLGRAPPIDRPIDPWVGHVYLAPHRLPTSDRKITRLN